MKKLSLYLFNLTSLLLPFTSFFALKYFLLKSAGIKLGDNVRLCGHTHFIGAGDVSIGENTWVGLNNSFYLTSLAYIKIGKNCDIAPEVSFIAGSHAPGNAERRAGKGIAANIEVGDGCWIGARVMILGGVKIGPGSMVAAGSLVLKDVPANCMVAGSPAIVKKQFTDE